MVPDQQKQTQVQTDCGAAVVLYQQAGALPGDTAVCGRKAERDFR